jgi:hypothetical protein
MRILNLVPFLAVGVSQFQVLDRLDLGDQRWMMLVRIPLDFHLLAAQTLHGLHPQI